LNLSSTIINKNVTEDPHELHSFTKYKVVLKFT
jgi:hypothetical protein